MRERGPFLSILIILFVLNLARRSDLNHDQYLPSLKVT